MSEQQCHCGRPVVYGFDGDDTHHRGMCVDCDAMRCDAYPMECPYREERVRAEAVRAFVQYVATDHAYNGADDPGQQFYDWSLNPWLDTWAEAFLALHPDPRREGEGT